MRRFVVLLALLALTVPVLATLAAAAEIVTPLQLEKECVLFGRIVGTNVMLYRTGEAPVSERELPVMMELAGFEILNLETGEWQPLALSEDGHFCANVGMGKYELRGRDSDGKPYVIHTFAIPRGMAVNLGSFWIETRNPAVIARENWFSYIPLAGWHSYRQGSGAISVRLEHVTDEETYAECESWFASCHEDVYAQFAGVIAHR